MGKLTVAVALANVAVPAGATETPSDFSAAAVAASRATDGAHAGSDPEWQ